MPKTFNPFVINSEQGAALTVFLSVFDEEQLMADIGPHLSCREADTLAELLKSFGYNSAARALITGHSLSDDDPSDSATHRALKRKEEREQATFRRV